MYEYSEMINLVVLLYIFLTLFFYIELVFVVHREERVYH